MSKQLYEEALADVKKLKEVAEDNAKKALLEAVTPRIKDLIENQLMGDTAVDDERLLFDDPRLDQDADESTSTLDNSSLPLPAVDLDASAAPAAADPRGASDSEEYELSMESVDSLRVMLDQNVTVSMPRRIAGLEKRIRSITAASVAVKATPSYSKLIESIISEVEDMYSCLQDKMQESSDKKTYETTLENHYSTLKQLMEQNMHKKNSTLTEADVTLKLTGLPDEIDLDSVGVDLVTGDEEGSEDEGEEDTEESDEGGEDLGLDADEEGSEDEGESDEGEPNEEEESDDDSKMESRSLRDNLVVEIDENMLRREIKRMKALREENETKPQSWGHGPGGVSDDFEDEDLGDPLLDVELTTESLDEDDDDLDEMQDQKDGQAQVEQQDDDLDEMQDQKDGQAQVEQQDDVDEADMDQSYMDELDELDMDQATDHSNDDPQTNKQNRMPESIRRRLFAEKRLQVEAKRKAQQAKQRQKEAQQKAQKSKQVQEKQKAKKQAKQMSEVYAFYAKKFNESVTRSNKLRGLLAEAANKRTVKNDGSTRSAGETSSLRKKLAETNLFNAKLLFTNKLLQNESLTRRQKAEVIERLDEAKTEREVKLVYESLVKALQGSSMRRVTESSTPTSVIGSSSRPVRPASTLNEGFEADRWARLAGIVK